MKEGRKRKTLYSLYMCQTVNVTLYDSWERIQQTLLTLRAVDVC